LTTRQRFRLVVLPGLYAIARLESDASIPVWASSGEFCSVTRTAEELSVVCPQNRVPDGVRRERGWRCLRVAATMDLSMVGVVASLVAPLAEANVSVFVVSTFDTDYLLVKDVHLEKAIAALRTAGHLPA
jgi:hypothetical protein